MAIFDLKIGFLIKNCIHFTLVDTTSSYFLVLPTYFRHRVQIFVCFWIFVDTPHRFFEGVFRILRARTAPRMLDDPVKSVGSVKKYPQTVKHFGHDVENRSGDPKIVVFCVYWGMASQSW